MNYNTIILLKGWEGLSRNEYKRFEKLDTILGDGSNPKELMRWDGSEEEAAREELAKYKCTYDLRNSDYIYIEEYALMFCDIDEDDDFSCVDYVPAEMIEMRSDED